MYSKRNKKTAVLFRIISNPLPGWSDGDQILAHLRFILDNEPDLPGLDKRWLLNRIASPVLKAQIRAVIVDAGLDVVEIPFRPEEYREAWTDIGETPEDFHPWNEAFLSRSPEEQACTVEYIARYKNRYLLNANGARNYAIRLGLEQADWVFPWDAGCFLPLYSWEALLALTEIGSLSYIAVPTALISDASLLLAREPFALSVQRNEPQLGFSRTARLHFDPTLRFGLTAKSMLLRRIGLPGPWQQSTLGLLPWEVPEQCAAPDAGSFVQAGVVFQLCDQKQLQEFSDPVQCQNNLVDSIRKFTRGQDLTSVRHFVLAQPLRCWTLLHDVDRAPVEPYPQRLHHEVVRQAGLARNLPTRPSGPQARWHELPWEGLCALSLDYYLHKNVASLDHLRALLRGWFLELDQTATRPGSRNLPLTPTGPCPTEATLAQLHGVYPLLDALTLARLAGKLSPAELQAAESAVDSLFTWLCSDSANFLTTQQHRPIATIYHLLVMAVSAHLGRNAVCVQAIDNLPGLLARQFFPDGSPRAIVQQQPIPEQLENLKAWAQIAVLCSCLGRDLLAMRDDQGHGLYLVLRHASQGILTELHERVDQAWAVWIASLVADKEPILDSELLPPDVFSPPYIFLSRPNASKVSDPECDKDPPGPGLPGRAVEAQ